MSDDGLHAQGRRLAAGIGFVAGAALHAIVGFFYLTSGLVVPALGLLWLWTVWGVLTWVLWRNRRRPAVTLAVPFVAAAVWWATLWFGDTVLGWTA